LKTANSGYLTRRVVDVSQDTIISEFDCGTRQGMEMMPLIEGGEIIERLGDRILGRVVLEDVVDPYTGEVLCPANSEITEDHVKIIDSAGIDRVKIRSVLACETRRGICSLCYGRDLARGHMVNIGEAVGVIAAQSIMSRYPATCAAHIGGVGQIRTEQSSLEARNEGTIRANSTRSEEGPLGGDEPPGELVLVDIAASASAMVCNARPVDAGGGPEGRQVMAEWDPFAMPIVTRSSGA
jgi:DNA-directed RNA polymerase subunit beta'